MKNKESRSDVVDIPQEYDGEKRNDSDSENDDIEIDVEGKFLEKLINAK
jgi:hypothetical protein